MEAIGLGLHKVDPVVSQRLAQLAEYLGVSDMVGLEYSDEIIRRRLVQLMEEKLVTQANIAISDGEIADHYNLTTGNNLSAPRISFKHIFLATADKSQNILSELNSGFDIKGDAFLAGHDFVKVSESSVSKSFGINFFTQLNLHAINRWQGPIASSFGYHWVSLSEYFPPQKLTLQSQQVRIRSALYEKRRKQVLTAQIIKLRDTYRNGWVSPPHLPASSS
jgi:peptidyl-prolyl cis-trans isomerase C